MPPTDPLPPLRELGFDLLRTPRWRRTLSLAAPFVLFIGYFAFAGNGHWLPAVATVAALSFLTYGSVSHDLVHHSLGLSGRVNRELLTVLEGLMLRSGTAYRLSHLHHHARYPHADDAEGRAAHGSVWAALADGPVYVPRLWLWAVRQHPAARPVLFAEAVVLLAFVGTAVGLAVSGVTLVPLAYAGLAYAGSWVFPLATAYLPHTPAGRSPAFQTRWFRGWVARLIAADHLYHLEHHLYPAVPHHRWPELARRLAPHLARLGVPAVRIGG